jgi:hypothetical protein
MKRIAILILVFSFLIQTNCKKQKPSEVFMPDLIISSGTPTVTPSIVAAGGLVQLSAWTIKNQGAGDCNSPTGIIDNGFYLSTDATITSGDTLLDKNHNWNLKAGQQFR